MLVVLAVRSRRLSEAGRREVAGGRMEHGLDILVVHGFAVRESRERVRSALQHCGFGFPAQRITVNLAPADVKKEGSAFDLPLAIGILGGHGLLQRQNLSDYLLVGELSLDGKLRPGERLDRATVLSAVREQDDRSRDLLPVRLHARLRK